MNRVAWTIRGAALALLAVTIHLLPFPPRGFGAVAAALLLVFGGERTIRWSLRRAILGPRDRRGRVLAGAGLQVLEARAATEDELRRHDLRAGECACWWTLKIEPRSDDRWSPRDLFLVPLGTELRPTFADIPMLGGVIDHRILRDGARPSRAFEARGSATVLVLIGGLDAESSPPEALLAYEFTPLGPVPVPNLIPAPVEGPQELRGLGCGEDDVQMLLVHAPPPEVASVADDLPADAWIFRLRGHSWTIVAADGLGAADGLEATRRVSRTLGGDALWLEHSDTAGGTGFALARGGEVVEVFGSGEVSRDLRELGIERGADPRRGTPCDSELFDSRRRSVDPEDSGSAPRFVDRTLREHDAWAPPPFWRGASSAADLAARIRPMELVISRTPATAGDEPAP